MTYENGNAEKSIFGIAYTISEDVIELYPGCKFGYLCEQPNYMAVTVTKSNFEIVELLYLFRLLTPSLDETEGPKRELLTYEAKTMVVQIERLIEGYGGRSLDKCIQGARPRFWFSGPYFEDRFLYEDAYKVGAEFGMTQDILDRLWNGDPNKRELATNKRVLTCLSPYLLKLQRESQM
jgi:hypothetical protein